MHNSWEYVYGTCTFYTCLYTSDHAALIFAVQVQFVSNQSYFGDIDLCLHNWKFDKGIAMYLYANLKFVDWLLVILL